MPASVCCLKNLLNLKYGSQPIKGVTRKKMQIIAILLLSLLVNSAVGEDYGAYYDYGGYFQTCPSSCTCDDLEIDCTNAQLSSIPSGIDTNLQRLVLKENSLSSIDSITSSLTSIVYIDASSNYISSVDWSSFSSLTTLEELHLQMNLIFLVDLSHFHSSILRVLNVSGNNLLNILLSSGTELALQELYIENCGLSIFNPGASKSLCQLQILHAGGNSYSSLPENFLDCMTVLRELKLNNLGLTVLSVNTFASTPSLQTLDLSNNKLTSLPDGIFMGLNDLRYLKLSGNPWSCDCSLIGLKIFLDSFLASGGIIQDESLTFCSSLEETPPTVTSLSAYDISGCAGAEIVQRVVRAAQTITSPFDWAIVCPDWQREQPNLLCGPPRAASCVYEYDNQTYAMVQYSTLISGGNAGPTCRDYCAGMGTKYFVFETSIQQCLCGDIDKTIQCLECSSSSSSVTGFCSNQYSNLQGASSIMDDLEIRTSPIPAEINSQIQFTIQGGVSDYDLFSWDFGDGLESFIPASFNTTVYHQYIYPGEFTITVNIMSSSSGMQNTSRVIKLKVVTSHDDGDLSCPSSVVSTFTNLNIKARFGTAWSQSVLWKREESTQNSPSVYDYYDEECESGWTPFGDRCLLSLSSNWQMSSAATQCTSQGGQLLSLYSIKEVEELLSTPEFFTQNSTKTYFTGAEWSLSDTHYLWKNSQNKAFINRAELDPGTNEDCVVVDASGLRAENCAQTHSVICEKIASKCQTFSNKRTCYVQVAQSLSRDEASAWCQTNYTNGRLAEVTGSSDNYQVTGLATSNSWIGLQADTMEGHYRWSDGDSLDSYDNWGNKGSEPCVVINSQGQWETEHCDERNPFICEYFVGDEIKVSYLVTGLPAQSPEGVTSSSITMTSTPMTFTTSVSMILPGTWVSKNGTISRWHLQTQQASHEQMIALQIWRPFCSSGEILDLPGCNSASPFYTCVTSQVNHCQSSNCQDGFYYCPLHQSCLAISNPCTCAGASVNSTLDCQNIKFDASHPQYELVHEAIIKIPPGSCLMDVVDDFNVVEGDIVGWQSENDDVLVCEENSASMWRQVLLSTSGSRKLNVGDIFDLPSLSLKKDVQCKVSLVYTTGEKRSKPMSLNYITEAGDYTFTVEPLDTASSTPPSCRVSVQDSVEGLVWIHPTPTSVSYLSNGNQVVHIDMLVGYSYTLMVSLLRGWQSQIKWSLDQGNYISTPLTASCPSFVSPTPEMCQQRLSFLTTPFSSTLASFPNPGAHEISVNASNDINSEIIHVSANVMYPITGAVLYHEDCPSNQNPCEVVVEVGVKALFSLSVQTGEISQTLYYKDGVLLNVGSLNVTTISYTFSKYGTYLLEVNVSNALSHMVANITVYARIPTQFIGLQFVDIPSTVVQQETVDIKASAKVILRSYYKVTWAIGEDNSTFTTESSTRSNIELSLPSQIFKDTGNVTISLYLEDAFGYNSSISTVVEVYRRISSVFVTVSESIVSTSESFTITIKVDNVSISDATYFGPLNFSLICSSINFSQTWTNTNAIQNVDHDITTSGHYKFSISVHSELEVTTVITNTVDVEVQEQISGLSLTYDGPKHINNQVTFQTSISSGTDVEYSLKLGDGSEIPYQTSTTFTYTYSTADVYQATLIARNDIGRKTVRLTLYAYDEDLIQIIKIHGRNCVAVNTSMNVLAEIAAEYPNNLEYSWDFGNGTAHKGIGEKSVTVKYDSIGDYYVVFHAVNPLNNKTVQDTKHICVEEKITGLSVDYVTPLALNRMKGNVEVVLVATVQSGSNISYSWNSGSVSHTEDFNTMNMTITSAGNYSVTVTVSNDVGRKRKTLVVTVIEVISGTQMSCTSCLFGMYTQVGVNTSFAANNSYGSDQHYIWTFDLSATPLTGASVSNVFQSEGRHAINLTVQNEVSNQSLSTEVIAQIGVRNVSINQNSSVIEVNQNVSFYASFTGSNVSFTWVCGSDSWGDMSSRDITVLFNVSGYHNCYVTVSNFVSTLTEVITVPIVDPISSLSIQHSLVDGPGNDWFAIKGDTYNFYAQSNTDFLVNFDWEMTLINNVQGSGSGKAFNFTFAYSGKYNIRLRAENTLSHVEDHIPVAVHERITNVALTSNSTSNKITTGDSLRFDVSIGSGTSMSYHWYQNNTSLHGFDDNISMTFTNAGTYEVYVIVRNKVSSENTSLIVNVYDSVSGVLIHTPSGNTKPAFVKSETLTEFSSPNTLGSNLIYNWIITSVYFGNKVSFHSQTVPYQFNLTGLYEVKLEVKNDVSTAEDSLIVEVQGALNSLDLLVSDTAVSTGSSVSLWSIINPDASNVTFTWMIDSVSFNSKSLSLAFNSSGAKNVSLTAENQVSSITKETLVVVFDPILDLIINGCQPLVKAQTSIRFEALTSTGSDVIFSWTVSTNGHNETTYGSSFQHVFPVEDTYLIMVTAKNNVSKLMSRCTIEAQLPVENITISVVHPHPEYIFMDKNAMFEVPGNNLKFATFNWTVTPAFKQFPATSGAFLNVTFNTLGNYTLTVVVKNDLSEETASLNFNVKRFLCDLPDITRVGSQIHIVERSQVLELEVAVDPKGCTEYLAVHSWTVFDKQDCTGNLDSVPRVSVGDTVISSPALNIKPNVLNTGTYCVRFTTGYQYTPVSESLHYIVTVKPSPLRAVIKGGTVRTVVAGETLCLDGQLSYDPDNTSSTVMTYQWICTEMTATSGCFQTAYSKTFCYSGFVEKTYNISLVVSAPGRDSDITMQMIDVLNVTDFVPTASIVCQSCSTLANYRISSSQHIALSASCENCQCEPEYSWLVYAGSSPQPLVVSRNETTTGLNGENLVLKKWGAVQDGMDYTFMVSLKCPTVSSNTGTASLTLSTNIPPSGGVCTFSPTQIIPLEDQVHVSCVNWFDSDDPDTLINYQILVDTPASGSTGAQTYVLYYGTDATQSVYLGSFSGDSVSIRVLVSDEFGASVLGGESTIAFLTRSVSSNLSMTDYLMNQTDNVLSALIKQASPIPLLQYAIAMGQMLNSESQLEHLIHEAGSGSGEEQARATIRDAITISLATSIPVSTLGDVRQMAYATRILTEESTEYLTEGSQILILETMEKMATILQQQNNIGIDRNDIPTEDLVVVIGNLLSAANARVYSSQQVWKAGRNISLDNFSTDFRSLRPEISSVVNHLDFLDVSLDDAHRQSVASIAVPLLESVLVSTLKAVMVDEDDIEVELSGLKVNAGRTYADNIALESTSPDSQISFPSTILSDVTDNKDEVFQVMVSHKNNPYTYGHSTTAQMTMPVQTLSFYDINGTSFTIQNLPESSRPTMYMMDGSHNITSPIKVGLLNESNVYDPVLSGDNQRTTTISTQAIKVWQVPDAASHVSEGGALHIQIRIAFLPNATHTTNIGTSVSVWVGIGYSPSHSRHDYVLSIGPQDMGTGISHRQYTFFLSGLSTSDRIFMQAKNQDYFHSVNLSVATYYSSCLFFDESTQTWSPSGCQSQAESTWSVTVCQCNHLTSFGGSGLVAISDIHFADLENLGLATNPVVFIAVACIFILYLLVAVICRYLDNLDLQRISRIPLCGRDGDYKYEIAIVTGRKFKSGTTSHIGIKLYGEANKGDARHLTKPCAFQRNCRDTFMVAHDVDLGKITKVLVWHDNAGLHPSWYLSRIEVKDIQSGSTFTFLVNAWLSLEMKDGVIQKTVKVADEEELERSRLTFSSIFFRKLGDLHAWMSVSDRPDHSRFNRVQRATCCLTSIYLYMCVNAVWYGVIKDKMEADEPLSWNSFGWEEVVIAMVSTIIVLPILLAISMLFKKTRCKESMFQEVLRPSTAQTIEMEAMCDMSRDGTSYRTMTPIDDWIPAIDRESTTDSLAAPTGLKRTVPLHGLQRKSGKLKPPGKRELWNKDNIMQSWPDKMPTWIKEVKADVKGQGSGATNSKWEEDEIDDLEEKLDEISAQITKEEKQKKRKMSQENRRKSSSVADDLFDSDDEWTNEGLENVNKDVKKETGKQTKFNPRTDAQLVPNLDRKHSRISTTSSLNTSVTVSDSGHPTTHSHYQQGNLWRDETQPSITSASRHRGSVLRSRSHPGSANISHQSHRHRSKKFSFPPWCVYVGYAVCMKLSLLAIIMILLYGYQFGSAIALKWLLSLFVSLLLSFFILEPLKVFVLALIVAVVTKDVRDEEHDIIDVEPKLESNEQIKDVRFKPLGGFALLQAKEEGKKKQRLYRMLRELVVFAFMVAVFMAIAFINFHSQNMYYTNNNIQAKFYENSSNGLNFDNLKSIPEYWSISQDVLARSIHLEEVEASESYGYLMGPAWLRQIRSEEESCPADSSLAWPTDARLSSGRCVGDGVEDPDTSLYVTGWNTPPSVALANYTYSSVYQLDLYSKFGKWLLYPGGGYVQVLGQTYNDTLTALQTLKSDEWIDLKTRAVFLELTLYYPSTDLTSCVTLLAEFPASGGMLTSMTITSEKLLRFISGTVDPLLVCQIMFTPFAIYLLVNLVMTMKQKGFRFMAHIWNWIDLAICLMAWTCIGLYITCVAMATEGVDDFVSNQSNPSHLFLVVKLHSVLRYTQAILLFLFFLKVVKQIRFSRPLYKFHMTLSMATTPLLGVFLIFITLLLAHAQLAHLLYGSLVYGYQGFHNTITSLFGIICGPTNFWPLFEAHRVLTHFVFLSFGVFVYGLTIALTIAVLTSSYKWSRSQMCYKTTLEARDYEMIDFMIKRFKVVAGIEKPKPAFRHVKFEGLPSLPSRGTSSNLSSRESSAEERISSAVSELGNQDVNNQNLDYLMASLLPTWDQVSQSFQKVEDLDKQEEETIRCLQDIVKTWNSQSNKHRDSLQLKTGPPAPIMGKPPLDPKATFLRVQGGNKGRKPTVLAGRPSMTPPSTFTADSSFNSQSWRPFSDQGVRSMPNSEPQISTISCNTPNTSGPQKGGLVPAFHQTIRSTNSANRLSKGKMVIDVHPAAGNSKPKVKKKRAWESGP